MNYILHLLVMIGIYLMVAYSLNLVIGFSGLLSLTHAAFYGIGAYAFTLLSIHFHIPFVWALILAFIITGILAYILGFPALKFRGDSFVLVTLGFQMIIFTILYNWVKLTRGPYGIPGIPRPVIFGWEIDAIWEYLVLVIFINLIVGYALFAIYDSPYGLALKALRDDETAAKALGKPAFRYFHYAFTLGGAFAAIPGALYATYVTYIDPTSFTLQESIFQVVILLLGGAGNKIGPFLGVVIMIILPELLRFLGLPNTIAPNVRQIIYGLALLLLMYYRPKGIAGEFAPK